MLTVDYILFTICCYGDYPNEKNILYGQ